MSKDYPIAEQGSLITSALTIQIVASSLSKTLYILRGTGKTIEFSCHFSSFVSRVDFGLALTNLWNWHHFVDSLTGKKVPLIEVGITANVSHFRTHISLGSLARQEHHSTSK